MDLTLYSTLSTELSTVFPIAPHLIQQHVEKLFTACGQDLGLYCCNLLVKKYSCQNWNFPVIYAKKR